jgi:sugar phosphate isomerase/epimerase
MNPLIICDDCNISTIAPFCVANQWGIEVQSFHDPDYINRTPDAITIHRKAIEKIKLRSLHGPFGDLCPGSFDSMVRDVARHRFEMGYDIAVQLDITHIVLHHGYIPGTSSPAGWLSRSTCFWNDFLDSKSVKMKFHIENMIESDPYLLLDVIKSINKKNVDVCLDIGHAHCFSKIPVVKWIKILGTHIGYVHMHDNHREKDEHLGLGEGSIPMVDVCQALCEYAPDALWAIEAEGVGIQKSLVWLEENGFIEKK